MDNRLHELKGFPIKKLCTIAGISVLSLCASQFTLQAQNPIPASSEDEVNPSAETLQEQIQDLRSKIISRGNALRTARRSLVDLDTQITKIEKEEEAAQKQRDQLELEVAKLDTEQKRIQEQIAIDNARLLDLETQFRSRLVANYKMVRNGAGVLYLASANSATDFLRRKTYLTRIAASDRSNVSELEQQIVKVERDRRQNADLTEARKRQLTQIDVLVKKLLRAEDEKREVREQQRREASQLESDLARLQKTMGSLESLLANITGGEGEVAPKVPVTAPKPDPTQETAPPQVAIPKTRPGPYTGAGLEPLRGKLLLPVSGRLLQSFGKQRHEEFAEVLFKKGIEMAAPPKSMVQAIAPGRVVVEQELPGIGLTIILDHGGRYYSLYGRLQRSFFRQGQDVQQSDSIGEIGEPDSQGRNMYFEIRFRGQAINPEEFIRNIPRT